MRKRHYLKIACLYIPRAKRIELELGRSSLQILAHFQARGQSEVEEVALEV